MKKLNLVHISAVFALMASSAYASESGQSKVDETIQASDYVGVSMVIPEKTQQLIGLKTVQAKEVEESKKISVTGRIPQDVERTTEIHAPESGVLHDCTATLGVRVKEGQVLCRFKSTKTGVMTAIESPVDGVVIADFSKPGDRIDTLSPIHTIADFSKIPVNFDVYEKDMGQVRMGQKVLVYSSAYPKKVFEGKIVFISPRIDETSFTLKIRALVENPDYLLKQGMFVRGSILVQDAGAHVSVPAYSVQNLDGIDVVFIQDSDGSFVPTEIEVTYSGHEEKLVQGDIQDGDWVVTDGAYSLKSKIMEHEIVGGCAHGH